MFEGLKGLTVNLVIAFFNNVPAFRFFCFYVERKIMDSCYMSWNKFQDYQLRFILINHFLDPSFVGELESCLLTARQHGSCNESISSNMEKMHKINYVIDNDVIIVRNLA